MFERIKRIKMRLKDGTIRTYSYRYIVRNRKVNGKVVQKTVSIVKQPRRKRQIGRKK